MDLKNWVSTFYFTPKKPGARNFEIDYSASIFLLRSCHLLCLVTFSRFVLVFSIYVEEEERKKKKRKRRKRRGRQRGERIKKSCKLC